MVKRFVGVFKVTLASALARLLASWTKRFPASIITMEIPQLSRRPQYIVIMTYNSQITDLLPLYSPPLSLGQWRRVCDKPDFTGLEKRRISDYHLFLIFRSRRKHSEKAVSYLWLLRNLHDSLCSRLIEIENIKGNAYLLVSWTRLMVWCHIVNVKTWV